MIIGKWLKTVLISENPAPMIIMNNTNPEELKALIAQIRSLTLSVEALKSEIIDLKALVQDSKRQPKKCNDGAGKTNQI
jgi:hypothetical protein